MGKFKKTKMKVAIAVLLIIAAVSAETFDSNTNMYENPWIMDENQKWVAACHRKDYTGSGDAFAQQVIRGYDENLKNEVALCLGKSEKPSGFECLPSSAAPEIQVSPVNYKWKTDPTHFKVAQYCVERCEQNPSKCPVGTKCVKTLYDISGQGVYQVCAWPKPADAKPTA